MSVHLAQRRLAQETSDFGTSSIQIMDHLMSRGAIRTNSEIVGEHTESERVGEFSFVVIHGWRVKICVCDNCIGVYQQGKCF